MRHVKYRFLPLALLTLLVSCATPEATNPTQPTVNPSGSEATSSIASQSSQTSSESTSSSSSSSSEEGSQTGGETGESTESSGSSTSTGGGNTGSSSSDEGPSIPLPPTSEGEPIGTLETKGDEHVKITVEDGGSSGYATLAFALDDGYVLKSVSAVDGSGKELPLVGSGNTRVIYLKGVDTATVTAVSESKADAKKELIDSLIPALAPTQVSQHIDIDISAQGTSLLAYSSDRAYGSNAVEDIYTLKGEVAGSNEFIKDAKTNGLSQRYLDPTTNKETLTALTTTDGNPVNWDDKVGSIYTTNPLARLNYGEGDEASNLDYVFSPEFHADGTRSLVSKTNGDFKNDVLNVLSSYLVVSDAVLSGLVGDGTVFGVSSVVADFSQANELTDVKVVFESGLSGLTVQPEITYTWSKFEALAKPELDLTPIPSVEGNSDYQDNKTIQDLSKKILAGNYKISVTSEGLGADGLPDGVTQMDSAYANEIYHDGNVIVGTSPLPIPYNGGIANEYIVGIGNGQSYSFSAITGTNNTSLTTIDASKAQPNPASLASSLFSKGKSGYEFTLDPTATYANNLFFAAFENALFSPADFVLGSLLKTMSSAKIVSLTIDPQADALAIDVVLSYTSSSKTYAPVLHYVYSDFGKVQPSDYLVKPDVIAAVTKAQSAA